MSHAVDLLLSAAAEVSPSPGGGWCESMIHGRTVDLPAAPWLVTIELTSSIVLQIELCGPCVDTIVDTGATAATDSADG